MAKIKGDLAKSLAGYRGENAIDYPLSSLPDKKYFIFHDLRLPYKNQFFQIDTLLASTKHFVILEVENIAGTVYFDSDFNQLIRSQDGREEAFADPITQINRQEQLLKSWLTDNKYPPIPITSLVVFSNPTTLIRTSQRNKGIYNRVYTLSF
jgi:Nuclease-related domain